VSEAPHRPMKRTGDVGCLVARAVDSTVHVVRLRNARVPGSSKPGRRRRSRVLATRAVPGSVTAVRHHGIGNELSRR